MFSWSLHLMQGYDTPIKAVIFDNDGTLIDTEALFIKAHEIILEKELPDWMKVAVLGIAAIPEAQMIINEYKLTCTPEEYSKQRDEKLIDLLPTAEMMPGAEDMVKRVIDKRVSFGIATSDTRFNFNLKAQRHQQFYSQFRKIVYGDEVAETKPSPELFLKLMKELGVTDPKSVLVLEDAPSGVKAANSAGMPVVMIPDPRLDTESELRKYDAHPTYVFNSLDEVNLELFQWDSTT